MKSRAELESNVRLYLDSGLFTDFTADYNLSFRSFDGIRTDGYLLMDNLGLSHLKTIDEETTIKIEMIEEQEYRSRYLSRLNSRVTNTREKILRKDQDNLTTYKYFIVLTIRISIQSGWNEILFKGDGKELVSLPDRIEELKGRLGDDGFEVYLTSFRKSRPHGERDKAWIDLCLVDNEEHPVRLRPRRPRKIRTKEEILAEWPGFVEFKGFQNPDTN